MPLSSRIIPCIWLDGQAEEAAGFYLRTFRHGRIVATSHYPESGNNPSGKPPGSPLTTEIELEGQRFTLLNGGPMFTLNPSISFFIRVDTPAEADRLFAALADGGGALMPIGEYPWSPRYGWVQDRYGVSWQVIAGPRPQGGAATIVPCLMFSGAQHGCAEDAMNLYADIFPRGRIDSAERYAADEGPTGSIKHGRFRLDGQEMVAMDSHLAHGITFNEALSLQVMCEDQATVDRYWDALGAGGEHGPCGWLKDRFGLSWQVVPEEIERWLTSKETAARDRAFHAMLEMTKLDIAALQKAFEG
jgi:predicted 3-demethylubiquinone-9 3-methyltransferase (glyoxalase superfamily)